MNVLRMQGIQAMNAVRGLDGALREMSETGKISAGSIMQLTSLLPLLASGGPMGFAVLGVGALGTAIMRTADAVEELKKKELQQHMDAIARATKDASKEMDAFFKALIGGAPEEEAAILERIDKIQRDAEERRALIESEVGLLTAAIPKLKHELLAVTSEFGKAALKGQIKEHEDAIKRMNAQIIQIGVQAGISVANLKALLKPLDKQDDPLAGFGSEEDNAAARDAALERVQAAVDARQAATNEMLADIPEARTEFTGLGADILVATAQTKNFEDQWKETMATLKSEGESVLKGTLVGAFDAYADALDKTISLNNLLSESTGRSMRNMLAQQLRVIGQIAMVHAAEEIALAITGFANPLSPTGSGGPHLVAAAKWAGVAALAGVAAGAVSVNAGGGGGTAGADPSGGGGGGRSGNTINVTVIGALDHASRRDLAKQLQDEMEDSDL